MEATAVSFGPPESVIIKALDDAVSDGMEIINFSWGSPAIAGALDDVQCGNKSGVWCDPLAHAFEVAAENGVVITTAAGDYGSDYFGDLYFNSIASPATAPSVISVGATLNAHVFNPTVSVNASGAAANLKGITAALSDAYFFNWTGGLGPNYYPPAVVGATSGTLVDVSPLGNKDQACSALPAGSLSDAYALIEQSTAASCTFDDQAINATNAGAIGIVFYLATASSTPAFPDGLGGELCYNNSSGSCDLYGPGVLISLSDGQNRRVISRKTRERPLPSIPPVPRALCQRLRQGRRIPSPAIPPSDLPSTGRSSPTW